jgi:putative ABC transport system ATP-binding protein
MTSHTQTDQQHPAARLRAVSRQYPNSSALRAVDLTLGRGEHVAVMGRSGSGKSTLLNMLTGIDRPTKGSVEVDGVDLAGLDEGALAVFRGRHIGIVFQFFQLLPTLSVRENVLLAMELVGAVPPLARDGRAQRLLEEVGVAAHADRLPGSLSGGEQQRAAIARALANDPELLVADEPTGNLDTETAASVAALLRDFARRGKTVVVVTHDPAVAATCSRVVQLTDGRLAERAS